MDLEKYIGVVPDFPKKGISFKDISPLIRNPEAFRCCIDELEKLANKYHPDVIIGPESRAFIFIRWALVLLWLEKPVNFLA